MEQLRQLPVAAIVPNPAQPRQRFDEQALAELADSLRQHGVLEPLVVRSVAADRYEIVCGERRWRASQLAGLATLPCRVIAADDQTAFILAATENVARQDMDVIEEANAYARILGFGKPLAEVASLFGKTEVYVRARLDLLRLDGPLQELVASGQLSRTLAAKLSALSREGQYAVLRRVSAGDFPSDTDACRYAVAVAAREAQPAMPGVPAAAVERAAVTQRRSEVERAWAQLERLGPALRIFLEADAEELAIALGPAAGLYRDRLQLLYTSVNRARYRIKEAAALAEAAGEHTSTN